MAKSTKKRAIQTGTPTFPNLFIKNVQVPKTKIKQTGTDRGFRVLVDNQPLLAALLGAEVDDLDPRIVHFEMRRHFIDTLESLPPGIDKGIALIHAPHHLTLAISLSFRESQWVSHLSLYAYFNGVIEAVRLHFGGAVQLGEKMGPSRRNYFARLMVELPNSGPIKESVLAKLAHLKDIEDNVFAALSGKDGSVVIPFHFPDDIKSACEQYLVHFVEFLRDLGVDAHAELHDDAAGQVLFSVTPADKHIALDNIRRALETYLHLPGSEVHASPVDDPNTALVVQKLVANVFHLRGQLEIARAQMALRDPAFAMQSAQRPPARPLLDVGQFISNDEIEKADADESGNQAVAPFISVSPVRLRGEVVDLPEFVRDVKKLFPRK